MLGELLAALDLRGRASADTGIDAAELDRRLTGLAAAAAEGRVRAGDAVHSARQVVTKAAERRRISEDLTVVALAGSTGAGKSSLFNAILGEDIAGVGVRRPTTAQPLAALWRDSASAHELLDWLGVSRRHIVGDPVASDSTAPTSGALANLVLLDLPDHDSTHTAHRAQVDRLVARVDVMIWVLDPQKYADALVHEEYLARFVHHQRVTVVVLNQIDRLTVVAADRCLSHLRQLVTADGLGAATVLATSIRSGQGLPALAEVIGEAVAANRAMGERLAADVAAAADALGAAVADPGGAPPAVREREVERLTELLTDAAGAGAIAAAVRDSHNLAATAAVGWPPVRWVSRLRADPVTKLRLDRPGVDPGLVRSSMPSNDPVALARARTAVLTYADAASAGAPADWISSTRDAADTASQGLPDHLDRAITRTDLVSPRAPRWWRLVGALQWLLLLLAALGGGWLLLLAGAGYLQLDPPSAPRVEGLPVPTLMLLVGLTGGAVLAVAARAVARSGAGRAARAARRALRTEVAAVVTSQVVAPIEAELGTLEQFRSGLRQARDER